MPSPDRCAEVGRRAVAAAVAVARERGVRVDEPVVLAGTDHLETLGAPVVPNSRELPPGPHERDGFHLTFTAYAGPDPDRTPDVADRLAMLPDLHRALAAFPGELPLLGPPTVDVPIGPAALDRHPEVLAPARRDRLLAAVERLGLPGQLAPASDLRAAHLALCMLSFRDAFGDDPRWDGYVRDVVSLLR